VTGVLWVLQEALRDRTPFGGFPWGRVAFSQGDSPLLMLAALGGAPLVTFGVAVVGGLLALAAASAYATSVYEARRVRTAALPLGIALLIVVAPVAWPEPSTA